MIPYGWYHPEGIIRGVYTPINEVKGVEKCQRVQSKERSSVTISIKPEC
jgi:hypothetical protein